MVTFLITSVFILGFIAVAIYFWQKPATKPESYFLPPPPPPAGLFSEQPDEAEPAPAISRTVDPELKAALLQRAEHGDKSTLQETHLVGDSALYDELLRELVIRAHSEAEVLSLVSYVARNELPVNKSLAEAVIDSWQQSPDGSSTAKTLHIVALSDDAALFSSTVETALQFWREGKLKTSPEELRALFDGEFWLLSADIRASGLGFSLKRTLANARRELEMKIKD